MAAPESDFDAIICGAGAGGLTAAILLARQGRRVLVIDKQNDIADTFKGELLQPGSLALMDSMGVLTAFRNAGARKIDRLISSSAEGTELCAMDFRWLPGRYNHCLTAPYRMICAHFAAALPGEVTVRRGTVVDGLRFDANNRVTGVNLRTGGTIEAAHAPLVVAADGRSSKLRAAADIAAEPVRYTHQVVALDLVDEPFLGNQADTVITRAGMRVMYPMPDRGGRLYIQIPLGFGNQLGKGPLTDWVRRTVGSTPALTPLSGSVQRGLHHARVLSAARFIVDRFHRPGLGLVGDAAHAVHPMAGQGMNAAIADAAALADALAAVDFADTTAIDAGLARYTAVRRPEVVTMSEFSHRFAELFTSTTTTPSFYRATYVLGCHGRNLRLSYKIMHNISGLGYQKFTVLDRLQQIGFPDRHARSLPQHGSTPTAEYEQAGI
jgi:2-polyprenyl-6-methoxyphenol hydroxylase-like FAD-dependent oxidoreductase